ncbi:hypothetical protein GFB49_06895 [Epibacterium sp. SM1979]|uniref:Mitochondrial inner membrane protein n=1 Tax=Tritonibacter litoralis TaxID=2662264 RepID=A0A843YFW2_9RHOB|nr:hypothetical protein [Tritonibacter litoralis]
MQVERIIEKRGGVVPTVIGGIIAAGLGFGLAQTEVLDPYFGKGGAEIESLTAAQSDLGQKLTDVTTRLDALVIPDLDPLAVRVDALEGFANDLPQQPSVDLSAIETKLADLQSQIAALQARPVTEGASAEATAAFEAEIAKLQDSFSKQREEVEAMFDQARALEQASAEAAKIASAQTVLARLRAAVDAGQPFGGMTSELSDLGVDVPQALLDRGTDGVSTLAALTESFAPAARAALAAVRDEGKDSAGLLDYVNRHLGARSVAPRDGDDPDAVLSRAEAAVRKGDLETAISETSTLPEAAASAMADWVDAAVARQQTLVAAETLSQSLNAN